MKNSNLKVMSLLALTFVVSNVCSANQLDSLKTQIGEINQRIATAEKSGYIQAYHQLKNLLRDTKELIPGFELNLQEITSQQDLAPYRAINYNNHIAKIREAIEAAERQEIDRAKELVRQEGRRQAAQGNVKADTGRLNQALGIGAVTFGAGILAKLIQRGIQAFNEYKAEQARLEEEAEAELKRRLDGGECDLYTEEEVAADDELARIKNAQKDALFVDAPGQNQEEINKEARQAILAEKKARLEKIAADPVKASRFRAILGKIGSISNPIKCNDRAKEQFVGFCNCLKKGHKAHALKSLGLSFLNTTVLTAEMAAALYLILNTNAIESISTDIITPAVNYAGPALSSAATNAMAYGQEALAPAVAEEMCKDMCSNALFPNSCPAITQNVAPIVTKAAETVTDPGFIKTMAGWANNLFISNGWS